MSSSFALRTAASVQTLWFCTRHHCERRIETTRRGEAGLTTLEIVVWGAGLFIAAGIAVGIIRGVIDRQTALIK